MHIFQKNAANRFDKREICAIVMGVERKRE